MFVAFWFLPIVRYITIWDRNRSGKKYTEKRKLKEDFIKSGGIVGFQPVNENHVALIFVSDSEENYSDVDFEYIQPIINDCNEKDECYKVYFCYLADDFINIVKSRYTQKIHIFGHGRIDSLRFRDGILSYRELKDTEPKELVAQWHCNHGDKEETSLGYHIGKEYYVPFGYVLLPLTKRNVKKFIEGKIKPKKNPKFNVKI